jgi:hypothetical protein
MNATVRRKVASVALSDKPTKDSRGPASESIGKHRTLDVSYLIYFSDSIGSLTYGIDALVRHFETCSRALAPYHPQDLLFALYGFILCFFGVSNLTFSPNFGPHFAHAVVSLILAKPSPYPCQCL